MSLETATAAADARRATGPHAFPTAFNGEHEGMTLRDYFAARAMQGMVERRATSLAMSSDAGAELLVVARTSYAIADALLTERSRR